MSSEDKCDDLMKSYQTIASSNQDLENLNAYLIRPIEEAKKQTRKAMKSRSGSINGDDGKSNGYILGSSNKKEPHRR